jgi:hypothetical protein
MPGLNPETFQRCAPALGTNIKQCGTVTLCDAKPLTVDQLNTIFKDGEYYRVMHALLFHDIEIGMCEARQYGLYEFLMANRVNLSRRLITRRVNSGLIQIAPFILARQYSAINNEYWQVSGGQADTTKSWRGLTSSWRVDAESVTNIPVSVDSFPPGLRVSIHGYNATAQSATETGWVVVDSAIVGGKARIWLAPENTFLPSAKAQAPVNGLLRRGVPNVSDYEQWCAEAPAYLNWKDVPFWIETSRNALCSSSLYRKWRTLLLEGNPLYREYGDLDEIAKNKQIMLDWQKRWTNQFFWGKPLPNQTLQDYDQLPDITIFASTTGLGVEGGRCVGKRANAIGIYEQLAQCGRIHDCQGQKLNLPALFKALYQIKRVREGLGEKADQIDIFTDSATAERINTAMLRYYNAKSDNMARLNIEVAGAEPPKIAPFGFNYRSYKLFWPAVTMNIITHNFFDDYLSAAARISPAMETSARALWILDFAGIYPGIIASKRVELKSGDLKTLAAVDPAYQCVMEVESVERVLHSVTWTAILECPMGNGIVENFSAEIPEHAVENAAYFA